MSDALLSTDQPPRPVGIWKRRKPYIWLLLGFGSTAGLVCVTAFDTRRVMQSFLSQIVWESEVWIAEDPAR